MSQTCKWQFDSSVRMKITDDQIIMWLKEAETVNRGMKCLMDKYQSRLYDKIWRMVQNHSDTDDVLQNVFVKIYKNISRFEAKSGLYTWAYRIAHNEALNLIRKRKSKAEVAIDYGGQSNLTAEIPLDEHTVIDRLNAAVQQLPNKQRIVFEMRYYDETPYEEMSHQLGTSVGALKASYHIAVKKIEQHLLDKDIDYGNG